jgi:hypothetical protein
VQLSFDDWLPPYVCGTGLRLRGSWKTTTDADGWYRFAPTPGGSSHETAFPVSGGPPAGQELKWFIAGPDGGVRYVPADAFEEGRNRRDWRLGPAPRIRGTLVGAGGAPLAGVAVEVRGGSRGSARVVTDGRGAFEVAELTPRQVETRDGGPVPLAWGTYSFQLPEAPFDGAATGLTLGPGYDDVVIELKYAEMRLGLELVDS